MFNNSNSQHSYQWCVEFSFRFHEFCEIQILHTFDPNEMVLRRKRVRKQSHFAHYFSCHEIFNLPKIVMLVISLRMNFRMFQSTSLVWYWLITTWDIWLRWIWARTRVRVDIGWRHTWGRWIGAILLAIFVWNWMRIWNRMRVYSCRIWTEGHIEFFKVDFGNLPT